MKSKILNFFARHRALALPAGAFLCPAADRQAWSRARTPPGRNVGIVNTWRAWAVINSAGPAGDVVIRLPDHQMHLK